MEGLIKLVTDSNNRPQVLFMYKQSRNSCVTLLLMMCLSVYPRYDNFSLLSRRHKRISNVRPGTPEDAFTVMDDLKVVNQKIVARVAVVR